MAGHEIDYLIVGHITHDVGHGPTQLGGTAFYAAHAALQLGRHVGVITRITKAMEAEVIAALPGVQFHILPTARPTTFENRYQGDRREQRLLWCAEPLTVGEVPGAWQRAPLVHLAPVAQDVAPSLLGLFDGQFVGLTPQGWLRRWGQDGVVRPAPLPFDPPTLGRATALVFSDEDVEGEAQARALRGLAQHVVQTRAGAPARLHGAEGMREIAACATTVVAPTGAGDVFATAFFIRLAEGAEPGEAVRFAHAAAALTISRDGPYRFPTRYEIAERLAAA